MTEITRSKPTSWPLSKVVGVFLEAGRQDDLADSNSADGANMVTRNDNTVVSHGNAV